MSLSLFDLMINLVLDETDPITDSVDLERYISLSRTTAAPCQ